MTPRQVEIQAYDERWPKLFEAERDALRAVSSNSFIDIEHFGSTAVPGLSAKPIIDVMASVPTLDRAHAIAPDLSGAGYRVIDVGFRRRVFLAKMAEPVGFHLHLVAQAVWEHKNERLFRDWLLTHPEVAHAYATLKRELADRFKADTRGYTAAKTAFIAAATNDARRHLGLPEETVWEE